MRTRESTAADLGLNCTAGGTSQPELFAQATGVSSWEETSIAEFGFGSRPDDAWTLGRAHVTHDGGDHRMCKSSGYSNGCVLATAGTKERAIVQLIFEQVRNGGDRN